MSLRRRGCKPLLVRGTNNSEMGANHYSFVVQSNSGTGAYHYSLVVQTYSGSRVDLYWLLLPPHGGGSDGRGRLGLRAHL